eukprot:scaffold100040_cov92-Cyclotella_meneghiniana.AAC.4
MVYFDRATLRFDGACQPNPGEGGAGYILTDDETGNVILEGRYYIGNDCTNNVAEYFGLISGLKALQKSSHTIGRLDIEGDSELVIRQMKDQYGVRSHRLRPLHTKARNILRSSGSVEDQNYYFIHIDRNKNARADSLARQAIQYESHWSEDYAN